MKIISVVNKSGTAELGHGERVVRAYNGSLGRRPQRGPVAERLMEVRGLRGAISPAEAENFQPAHTQLKKGQICHILDILDKRRAATALALALASDFSRLDQYEIRYDTVEINVCSEADEMASLI